MLEDKDVYLKVDSIVYVYYQNLTWSPINMYTLHILQFF